MAVTTNSSGQLAELTQISAKLQLPMFETEKLHDSMVHDILRAIYRYPGKTNENGKLVVKELTKEEREINADVEMFYKKLTGQQWPAYQRKIRAPALFGPPGHGKTSVTEAASRTVAEGMGWRYISAEELDLVPIEEIDHKTFVFISHETAAAVTAIDLIGMPSKEKVSDRDEHYMDRLFGMQILKMQRAGGCTFLFDDALNAPKHIQGAMLPVTDRRRYGSLNFQNSLIAVTGNLGALDDSDATRAASPLRGRVKSSLVYDTVENFIARTRANPVFRDELGDVFVRQFFYRYPELFTEHPKRGTQGGFASPRGWNDFIHDARDILHRHGGRTAAPSARAEIVESASQILGPEVASKYNAFLESVLTLADPLAHKVIHEGDLDVKTLETQYTTGGGFNQREQQFGYQYAMALVDYAVQKIIQDDKMDEAIVRFGKGVSVLTEDIFAFAVEELQTKMAAQVETLEKGKVKVSVPVGNTKKRKMDSTASEQLGHLIMKSGEVDMTRRATLISVLSEMSKHATRATAPGRRVRRSD